MIRRLSVAAALLVAACTPADTQSNQEEAATSDSTPAAAGHGGADDHGGMSATLDRANPDRSFAEQMIPHHRGAVEMAEQELALGKDPEMRALATRIIADQKREIAQLEAWLAKPQAK